MSTRRGRALALLITWVCLGAAPASQPYPGAVAGRISTADGAAVPEMIVYLAPADPGTMVAPAREVVPISQKGAQFSPAWLVISVGQTVEFKNDEEKPLDHNVFSRSPAAMFDLGLYAPPLSKQVTFTKPGPVRLFCSIHRYMDGLIYVCPTPLFAHVAADGRFQIANVPAGRYTLHTWQRRPRYPERAIPIDVDGSAHHHDIELSRGTER